MAKFTQTTGMSTEIEQSQREMEDRIALGMLVYCGTLILSIMLSMQLEIPLLLPVSGFLLLLVLGIILYYLVWSSRQQQDHVDFLDLPDSSSYNSEESQKPNHDEVALVALVYSGSFGLSVLLSWHFGIPLLLPMSVFLLLTVIGIIKFFFFWSPREQQDPLKLPEFSRLIDIIKSFSFWSPREQQDPPKLPEFPQLLSYDSSNSSQYGSICSHHGPLKVTNEERLSHISSLRTLEKGLQKELEVLDAVAREAYKKHAVVLQYFCTHDNQKMSIRGTKGHAFEANAAWYVADIARKKKSDELRIIQEKIRQVRADMQENFYEMV